MLTDHLLTHRETERERERRSEKVRGWKERRERVGDRKRKRTVRKIFFYHKRETKRVDIHELGKEMIRTAAGGGILRQLGPDFGSDRGYKFCRVTLKSLCSKA